MTTFDNINTFDTVQPVLNRTLPQLVSVLIMGVAIGFVASQLTGDIADQLSSYIQYDQPVQFEDWHGNVRRSSAS